MRFVGRLRRNNYNLRWGRELHARVYPIGADFAVRGNDQERAHPLDEVVREGQGTVRPRTTLPHRRGIHKAVEIDYVPIPDRIAGGPTAPSDR
jgi:hypothetical protein